MNIYNQFTAITFFVILIILIIAFFLVLKFKKGKINEIWNVWIFIISIVITCLFGFYQEEYCSGMYCGRRYGFPRQIFEMAHYIGKDQVDVRVMSKVYWDYFLQNFLLIYFIFNTFRILFKK